MQNPNMQNPIMQNPNMFGPVPPSAVVVPPQMAISNPNIVDKYPTKAVKILSILGIIFGSIMIILNISGLILCNPSSWMIGHGFWVGIFVIVTSSIGLYSAASKGKGVVIAFLVLSCISTALAFVHFCLSVTGSIFDRYHCLRIYRRIGHDHADSRRINVAEVSAVYIIAALISFAQLGIGIWQSVIGCRYTCCYSNPNQAPSVSYYHGPLTGQMGTNVVIMQYPNQQVIPHLQSAAPVLPSYQQSTFQTEALSQLPPQQPSRDAKTPLEFD